MLKREKKVLAVVDDLFFAVKINEAAKRSGMNVQFLKTEEDVLEGAKTQPTLMIFDLNNNTLEPLNLITRIKSDPETRQVNTLAFVSHVQGELKQKAQESGCDMVMARSAFSQNLPQILRRHSGIPA